MTRLENDLREFLARHEDEFDEVTVSMRKAGKLVRLVLVEPTQPTAEVVSPSDFPEFLPACEPTR